MFQINVTHSGAGQCERVENNSHDAEQGISKEVVREGKRIITRLKGEGWTNREFKELSTLLIKKYGDTETQALTHKKTKLAESDPTLPLSELKSQKEAYKKVLEIFVNFSGQLDADAMWQSSFVEQSFYKILIDEGRLEYLTDKLNAQQVAHVSHCSGQSQAHRDNTWCDNCDDSREYKHSLLLALCRMKGIDCYTVGDFLRGLMPDHPSS